VGAHLARHLVAQLLDHPDWIIAGDQPLQIDKAHETPLGRQFASHAFEAEISAQSLRTFQQPV
jgi:hypothetical protein